MSSTRVLMRYSGCRVFSKVSRSRQIYLAHNDFIDEKIAYMSIRTSLPKVPLIVCGTFFLIERVRALTPRMFLCMASRYQERWAPFTRMVESTFQSSTVDTLETQRAKPYDTNPTESCVSRFGLLFKFEAFPHDDTPSFLFGLSTSTLAYEISSPSRPTFRAPKGIVPSFPDPLPPLPLRHTAEASNKQVPPPPLPSRLSSLLSKPPAPFTTHHFYV